jgi:hypothetical protein
MKYVLVMVAFVSSPMITGVDTTEIVAPGARPAELRS